MTPHEFISRCVDAANAKLTVPNTTSLLVANMAFYGVPMPMLIELNDFYINLEIVDMHEMLMITAAVTEGDARNFWEATMVYSKMHHDSIAHWTGDISDDEDEFTLFRLVTNDRLQFKKS